LCENGECNTVVVKDQSRLGRHNANVLLLLDFFKRYSIRFIYAMTNFDSDINDDSFLGINAWADERYIRDCSEKQKTNVKERQEKRGLIIMPPFGYKKIYTDNKKELPEIVLDENTAYIVKEIFDLYLQGYGTKAISLILNEKGRITPNAAKQLITGKVCNQGRNLWYNTAVSRILKDESYTGTLVNRKTVRKVIHDKRKNWTPDEERIRHDNVFPIIISKDIYNQVQLTLAARKTTNARAGKGNKIHLFTGVLKCKDCGSGFIYRENKYCNYEASYKCGTHHKLGKNYCTAKTFKENELKAKLMDEISILLNSAEINHDKIDKLIEEKNKKSFDYKKTVFELKQRLMEIENRIQNYIVEKNKGTIKPQMADKFIEKDNIEYESTLLQIEELEKLSGENDVNKTKMLKSIDILKAIVKKGKVDRQTIELLVKEIIVLETPEKKLEVDVYWNAPFSYHKETPSW